MIQPKLKICSSCGKECYLWKSNPKLCKDCAMKIKSKETGQTSKMPTPIKRVSDKRAKLDQLYNVAAALYKKTNTKCMAKLKGCTGLTNHVHHLFSGASRSKYYLDQREWIGVCNNCHHQIHDVLGMDELINLGLKKIE